MTKHLLNLVSLLFLATFISAQPVFINEIHYDNVGTDENEGIEIAGPAGTDLSCYSIELYNGNAGTQYLTQDLSGTIPDEVYGYGAAWFPIEGIQNGSPDGILLYNTCNSAIVQFISYEGSMIATDGNANGLASADIGVEQSSSDPGVSLQLFGTGSVYNEFTWTGPITESRGLINPNQVIGGFAVSPLLDLNPAEIFVSEDAGTATFNVVVNNMGVNPVTITLASTDESEAQAGSDFNFTANSWTFMPGNNNQSLEITVDIIDDEEEEMDETVSFTIEADAPLINNTASFVIIDNDEIVGAATPYDIADATVTDANGVPTLAGQNVELTGVVHGININPNGLQFTFIDPTGGIGLYSNSENFGYTVAEGDEVKVIGTINHFNGLTQIAPSSVELLSSGNTLQTPTEVTALGEDTESEMTKILNMFIVDPADWVGDGGSFNVPFTLIDSPTDTIYIRVDGDTELSSVAFDDIADNGANTFFSITGIGGQYDPSEPHDSGYQLFPMYMEHIQTEVGVAIEMAVDKKIQLYPNPVQNNLLVNAEQAIEQVVIYNANGMKLLTTNQSNIDVSNFEKGVYSALIFVDGKAYSQQFIKE